MGAANTFAMDGSLRFWGNSIGQSIWRSLRLERAAE
jgi:hypothetical protein